MSSASPIAIVEMPTFVWAKLFLLDAYAKNDRASLSHAERNSYRQVVAAITAVLKEQKT